MKKNHKHRYFFKIPKLELKFGWFMPIRKRMIFSFSWEKVNMWEESFTGFDFLRIFSKRILDPSLSYRTKLLKLYYAIDFLSIRVRKQSEGLGTKT